jgi:hypothetical protein
VIEKRNGLKGPYLYDGEYGNGSNNFFMPVSQKIVKVSEFDPTFLNMSHCLLVYDAMRVTNAIVTSIFPAVYISNLKISRPTRAFLTLRT